MPMWRCPHCGTPQAETARCWVCHRSSTTCGTCRHFRHSVAAQLGYCGLDRKRQPLNGDEIRGCWEAWPEGASRPDGAPSIGPARPTAGRHRHLEFIEVSATSDVAAADLAAGDVAATEVAATADGANAVQPSLTPREPGWSLWGDLDR
jgi:hypothetical protein